MPNRIASELISGESLYEVIDGVIVEKPPMGSLQEFTVSFLHGKLFQVVYENKLGFALVETLFDLGPKVKNKRRPDLAFLSAKRWPLDKPVSEANGLKAIPNLAIEIVSRSNGWDDVREKTEEYLSVGVERVWVVSPRDRDIHIYDGSSIVRLLKDADVLTDDLLPGFNLELSELFAFAGDREKTS
ncbi:MAG: Uma2 family endonuclease [Planctomycetota bacterium]|nr:Uma2 family endonuclease [Planctomycetota bacterium]